MKIIYDQSHKDHQPKNELDRSCWTTHPDIAERIEKLKEVLTAEFPRSFRGPQNFPEALLGLVHPQAYIDWLKKRCQEVEKGKEYFPKVFFWYDRCFDVGTPIMYNTYEIAWKAARVALTGAQMILDDEEVVYALTRPPGHHARSDMCGGYCYFNNAALAAEYLSTHADLYVAILDLDYHHGNGTQEIFYDRDDVLYISIHGDPQEAYPYTGYQDEIGVGEGRGYNMNMPLPKGSGGKDYLKALEVACDEINRYDPEVLIISMGFDTHAEDPIGGFCLKESDFFAIGRAIDHLKIPKLFVQEGGYNPDTNAAAIKSLLEGLGI